MNYYVVKKIDGKPCQKIDITGEIIFDCSISDKWEIVSVEYNEFRPVKDLILHIRKIDEAKEDE